MGGHRQTQCLAEVKALRDRSHGPQLRLYVPVVFALKCGFPRYVDFITANFTPRQSGFPSAAYTLDASDLLQASEATRRLKQQKQEQATLADYNWRSSTTPGGGSGRGGSAAGAGSGRGSGGGDVMTPLAGVVGGGLSVGGGEDGEMEYWSGTKGEVRVQDADKGELGEGLGQGQGEGAGEGDGADVSEEEEGESGDEDEDEDEGEDNEVEGEEGADGEAAALASLEFT